MYLEGRSWSFTQGGPTSKSLVLDETSQSTYIETHNNNKKNKTVYCLLSPQPLSPLSFFPPPFPPVFLFLLLYLTFFLLPLYFRLSFFFTENVLQTNTSFPVRHSFCYIPYEYRVLRCVMLRQCCHNNKSPAISLFQRYIARQDELFRVPCSYPPFLLRRKLYFLSFMFSPFLSPFNSCFYFFSLER